jgi:hypothetical protein
VLKERFNRFGCIEKQMEGDGGSSRKHGAAPTVHVDEEAILTYALHIGFDPVLDREHVIHGLNAELEHPWKSATDDNGNIYYFKVRSGGRPPLVQWEHPSDEAYRKLATQLRRRREIKMYRENQREKSEKMEKFKKLIKQVKRSKKVLKKFDDRLEADKTEQRKKAMQRKREEHYATAQQQASAADDKNRSPSPSTASKYAVDNVESAGGGKGKGGSAGKVPVKTREELEALNLKLLKDLECHLKGMVRDKNSRLMDVLEEKDYLHQQIEILNATAGKLTGSALKAGV